MGVQPAALGNLLLPLRTSPPILLSKVKTGRGGGVSKLGPFNSHHSSASKGNSGSGGPPVLKGPRWEASAQDESPSFPFHPLALRSALSVNKERRGPAPFVSGDPASPSHGEEPRRGSHLARPLLEPKLTTCRETELRLYCPKATANRRPPISCYFNRWPCLVQEEPLPERGRRGS